MGRVTRAVLLTLLSLPPEAPAAEKLKVKIIDRQDSQTGYEYVVPAQSTGSATTNVDCTSTGATANCSGTTNSSASSSPARRVSYSVTGATFSLLLPDGRIAVVNCNSKLNWTDWSRANQQRRSCRIPMVNELEAEFDGDKAKLKWSISIDGKKLESETYKIVAVIAKNQ